VLTRYNSIRFMTLSSSGRAIRNSQSKGISTEVKKSSSRKWVSRNVNHTASENSWTKNRNLSPKYKTVHF
jgi:hypothetical protein